MLTAKPPKPDDYRAITVMSREWTVGSIVAPLRQETIDMEMPLFPHTLSWDDVARSRYIESLVIGIPTSDIVLVQETKTRYRVLDGFQRLQAIAGVFQLPVPGWGSEVYHDVQVLSDEMNGIAINDPSILKKIDNALIRCTIVTSKSFNFQTDVFYDIYLRRRGYRA